MRQIFIFCLLVSLVYTTNAQTFRVGWVTDFEQSPVIDSIFQVVSEEINKAIGPARRVQLAPERMIYDNTSLNRARDRYLAVAAQSDIVLLLGSVSVKGSLAPEGFPVPTLGIGVVDPYLQELPYDQGRTGIDNFSYIWAAGDLQSELSIFRRIYPFKKLTVLANETTSTTFNEDRGLQFLDSLESYLDANIETVGLGDEIAASLANLPANTDAVYLSNLDNKTAGDIRSIADALKTRQIPSFSSRKWHVDQGILASVSEDNDFEQIARKLAIMIDESLSGAPLSEMPVNINFKEDLYINSKTANAIEIGLSFDILFTANFLDEEEELPTYAIEEVMEMALEQNFDIKISNQDIALAVQETKRAKTAMMPNLDLGLNAVQIDEASTSPLFDQSESRLSGQLILDQIIFSERAVAGIKVAYYLRRAQEYATESEILEVLLNTYFDYFRVLAAKTVIAIEKENLENLKTNLELARLRVDLGSASRAEILRWESEVAAANQVVVESSTNLLTAKYQLNTSLANTLEREFDIADVTIDDDLYLQFRDNTLSEFVTNPKDVQLVTDFLVDEAITNNPNKQFLLEQIRATERINEQNKRLFYTPNVALQAQTQQVLYRGGAGSEEDPELNPFNDNRWSVGIGLTFPIFAANSRRVDLQTSRIQLEQLNNTKQRIDQQLELAVRTSVLSAIATSTNIEFSRVSSDNAVANFELVRDRYQAGEVTVTQLFDAQVTALRAKQRYAVAVYDYLQAHLQLEFAVGFFTMFATDDELLDFGNRFLEFRNN